MIIVMNTTCSDEYNNDRYDFAVVKIEEFEAKKLAGYLKLFEATKVLEPNLSEMCLNDADVECEFYPCDIWEDDEKDIMPEKVRNDLDEFGWAIIDDDYELPFTPRDAHAPEGTYVMISDGQFWWHTLPPNVGFTVDSVMLDAQILQRLL